MDISIGFVINQFFSEGTGSFLVTLRATNINIFTLTLIILALCGLPLISILIYRYTEKKELKISYSFPLIIFLIISYLSLDYLTDPSIKKRSLLPFSFFPKKKETISLNNYLKKPMSETEAEKNLSKKTFSIKNKPNICLFIAESFRSDLINKEKTPNLYNFKNECLRFQLTLANANSSQISWFSIFHSNYPYLWRECQKNKKKGSLMLQLLKKLGYSIHLYTSAELSYFHMDKFLFGEYLSLIDKVIDLSQYKELTPAERDRKIFDHFANNTQKNDSILNIFFLDATHSEYSWPSDFPTFYKPISSSINYVRISQSKKKLPLIKNRYFNAARYIDHLFGKFNSLISNDSIIVFTGDHGEEFFEEGSLFHSTHLNSYQTEVPILMRLPNCKGSYSHISHIDIFPTLIHYLTGKDDLSDLADGSSIFNPERCPYVMTVQQNNGHTPYLFQLHNGEEKIIGSFLKKNIFSQKSFHLLSIKNKFNQTINADKEFFDKKFNLKYLTQ